MGASKEMFMQIRMMEEDYNEIPPEVRERTEIMVIDEVNPNYKEDELWCELDKKSKQAYREKKKREFELRNR